MLGRIVRRRPSEIVPAFLQCLMHILALLQGNLASRAAAGAAAVGSAVPSSLAQLSTLHSTHMALAASAAPMVAMAMNTERPGWERELTLFAQSR